MTGVRLALPQDGRLSVLCIGAHSDDIEIGCGGAVLRLQQEYPAIELDWVVLCTAEEVRRKEALDSMARFTAGKVCRPRTQQFRDGFLPYRGAEVKDYFEQLKRETNPDLILTHWSGDAHQDHRLACELTWNTFRNHTILEYEIPKYDGDAGRPNVYIPLEEPQYRAKVSHLMEVFGSQRSKRWFDEATFLGLMRLRGMECNSTSGYAEAFHCRKLVF